MSNLQKFIGLGKVVFIRVGSLPFVLAGILIVFSIWQPAFLSPITVFLVSRQATYLIVVTVAQMLALLSAGLDLSIGGTIALISVVTGSVMVAFPAGPIVAMVAGCLAGIGVGTLVGFVNGSCISFLGISPFLITFATGSAAAGLALILSAGGMSIFGLPTIFVGTWASGDVLGVPIPVMITILLVGVMYFVLSWTRFGRYLYALGGSREAALVMGIPVKRYTFLTYVIVGALVGIGAVMMTARTASGEPTLGLEMSLLSITAAILGGISYGGGSGKIYGAVLGAIAITLLRFGMDMAMIGSFVQMGAMGVVLILVTAVEGYRRQLRA